MYAVGPNGEREHRLYEREPINFKSLESTVGSKAEAIRIWKTLPWLRFVHPQDSSLGEPQVLTLDEFIADFGADKGQEMWDDAPRMFFMLDDQDETESELESSSQSESNLPRSESESSVVADANNVNNKDGASDGANADAGEGNAWDYLAAADQHNMSQSELDGANISGAPAQFGSQQNLGDIDDEFDKMFGGDDDDADREKDEELRRVSSEVAAAVAAAQDSDSGQDSDTGGGGQYQSPTATGTATSPTYA